MEVTVEVTVEGREGKALLGGAIAIVVLKEGWGRGRGCRQFPPSPMYSNSCPSSTIEATGLRCWTRFGAGAGAEAGAGEPQGLLNQLN